MKYQQVSVDFVNMVFTAFSYVALAGAAWIFLRLLQACFWLPRHLRKQNDVQQMLQEKVSSYEQYLRDCEEREKAEQNPECSESTESAIDPDEKPPDREEKAGPEGKIDNRSREEKWKERRECLEMLKKELKRVQNGGDIYDWDYLLEEDDKPEDEATVEPDEAEATKKQELSLAEGDSNVAESASNLSQTIEEKKDK